MEAAKELYLKYAGSHFQMEREGEYDEYLRFGVTREQESVWADERIAVLFEEVRDHPIAGTAFHDAASLIRSARALERLGELLGIVEHAGEGLDTFTRLRFAEEFVELARWLAHACEDTRLAEPLRRSALSLLDDAGRAPFTIDPWYKALPHLRGVLDEERVRQRIADLRERV